MSRKKKNQQLNIFSNPEVVEAQQRFDDAYTQIHDKIKQKGGKGDSHQAYNQTVSEITEKHRPQVDRSNSDEMNAWGAGYEESTEHLDCADDAQPETVKDAANFGFWRFFND